MSPKKQKELGEIIKCLFEQYKSLLKDIPQCQLDCIVSPGFPILWFGDIERYFSSSEKTISIGINPSSRELTKGTKVAFKRFPGIEYSSMSTSPGNYCNQLNHYFENEPYIWFKRGTYNELYEGYLKKGLIHIDCYSAIATKPSWSKLCTPLKKRLRDDNAAVFKDILTFLAPKRIYLASSKTERLSIIKACKEALGESFNSFDDILKYR